MNDAGCTITDPVWIVPVGAVFVELSRRFANPLPGDTFELATRQRLAMTDLFQNPYVNWPLQWPLAAARPMSELKVIVGGLTRRDPTKPHDDIHASWLGIYVAALTHFATLYGQSPEGLRYPAWIGPTIARTLQCIVWSVVVNDPQSGVHKAVGC
jgi:hypothetical protein